MCGGDNQERKAEKYFRQSAHKNKCRFQKNDVIYRAYRLSKTTGIYVVKYLKNANIWKQKGK